MKAYVNGKIRNVAVLGHGSCGKTSLTEAMAFISGMTSRMGNITDGNTISDYDKEEIKRGFSISTSLIPVEWQDTKINILDTPGYPGFVGEVEEAVSVSDAAIIVVSGKSGIEVGTKKAWNLCEKYNLPRIFYVSDMDILVHNNCDEIKWKGFSSTKKEGLTGLQRHYQKHVVNRGEFGGMAKLNQNDYLKLAKKFAGDTGEKIQRAKIGNFYIKYDPETRFTFIGHTKKREIRSFYQADLSIASDPFKAAQEFAEGLCNGK